ncbi:type III pantothenate kinase [Thermophilibacter immobilis]|jgi:type III pantothenate kinase|uniref:Type III pantothenate kinase n=1 Tax=Thermophilibacter immobilis TaxID=2779519 RepID=A0A7S7M8L7_9ACTN|nr:type III pantothenate kinase [Thermophilibacter immobilis]QOY60755.1 type III pantothenate kinase [Thermophilibacter immobilis]
MFLAIDVGNTQTTLGLFGPDGALVHGWRMATNASDTTDTLHANTYAYFAKDGLDLAGVTDAGVASVVPALERGWRQCLGDHLGHTPLVVSAAHGYGMSIAMPDPLQVGADRIANAIAARATYGVPVIVVDFGTATNIDVVDQAGAYRGGAISPGLMLSAEALFSKAAKLASVSVEAPAHALGDSTETALQSGLVVGAAAQAEGLVRRIRSELGAPEATVVGTGGLARTVAQATDLFDAIDPDLTLRGIREIWLRENERNQDRRS